MTEPKLYDIWERECGHRVWLLKPLFRESSQPGWDTFECGRHWDYDLKRFIGHTTDIVEAKALLVKDSPAQAERPQGREKHGLEPERVQVAIDTGHRASDVLRDAMAYIEGLEEKTIAVDWAEPGTQDYTGYYPPVRVQVCDGWYEEGKEGAVIGPSTDINGMRWTPVLWDGEEDPTWFKQYGLNFAEEVNSEITAGQDG